MPMTERVIRKKSHHAEETLPEELPTRDEETQQKLDDAEVLLDEIDAILEVEPTVRTLADLMREGSKTREQAYGIFIEGENGPACALGTAYLEAKRRSLI